MGESRTRQIPLPPLSQHLREFAARRAAWLVLARNLIPVVGIYAFGWSAALAVFNYWFDGLAALELRQPRQYVVVGVVGQAAIGDVGAADRHRRCPVRRGRGKPAAQCYRPG